MAMALWLTVFLVFYLVNSVAFAGTCLTGCSRCSSILSCSECSPGYYHSGSMCNNCPYGCADQCNATSGACNCKESFTGTKCNSCSPNFQGFPFCSECITGYYGTSCQTMCPERCMSNKCYRQTGWCSIGCADNRFTGVTCDECNSGLYGQNCELRCPVGCFLGICYRYTGFCQICNSNLMGITCSDCELGRYGATCSELCSSKCHGQRCNRETGACTRCTGGYWGNRCDFPCSKRCSGTLCNQTTGECTGGCMTGFSGDMCCVQGQNCQICKSNTICSTCMQGWYGNDCSNKCPENCDNKMCNKDNGACLECIGGYHGDTCEDISTNTGPAIGGSVAGVVVVVIVVIVVVVIYKRRTRRKNDHDNDSSKVSYHKKDLESRGPMHSDDGRNISVISETVNHRDIQGYLTPLQSPMSASQSQVMNQRERMPIPDSKTKTTYQNMPTDLNNIENTETPGYVNHGPATNQYEQPGAPLGDDHIYIELIE